MKEDYPIFTKWYKILNYIIDKVEKYPKNVRFTISDRIINLSFDIMESIIDSIYSKNRSHILDDINLYMEKLRIYIRISKDRKYLSLKQYEYLSDEINEIGSMVGGWKKTVEKSK